MQEGKVRFRIRIISCSKDTLELNGESQSFWVFSAGLKSKQLIESFWFYNEKRIASFSCQNSCPTDPTPETGPGLCTKAGAGTRGHLWAEMPEAMPMSGSGHGCRPAELRRQLESHFESFLDSWSVCFPSPLWLIGSQRVSLRRVKNVWYGHHVEGKEYLVWTPCRGPAGMWGGPCRGRRGTCSSRWRWQTFRFLQLPGWRGLFKDKSWWHHLT